MDYCEAKREIEAGRATAHALWMLLRDRSDRDGYALRPALWAGPGEYQRVSHVDGRDVLVRLPLYQSLRIAEAA